IVCLLVCVCVLWVYDIIHIPTMHPHAPANRRSPPHYAPTEPVPLPPQPPPPPPHTSVCVWLWQQQQRAAAGESPTRSLGVCTANPTHTARDTTTRPDHHSATLPLSGPHLLERDCSLE